MEDLHLLEKLVKHPVVTPGEVGIHGIEKWEEWCNIPYPVLNQMVPRAHELTPPPEWDDELEERLSIGIPRDLETVNRGAESTDRQKKTKDGKILKLESERRSLIRQREELTLWEYQEITNCLFGKGLFTPNYYFYYNYVWMEGNLPRPQTGKGVYRPLMRSCDNWFFRAKHQAKDEHTGFVGGKRRQIGYGWLSAGDDLWDILFEDATIFFITKEDADARKYFRRFNSVYDRLPAFLQKERGSDAQTLKTFLGNEKIARVKRYWGLIEEDADVPQAVIRPGSGNSLSNLAGETCSKIKIDEIGEIGDVQSVLGIMLPSLNAPNSTKRAGYLVGMGTVGRMDRTGTQFEDLYNTHYVYNVMKVWMPGWMGYEPDDFGNDNKQEAAKDIYGQAERYEKAGKLIQLSEWFQQYPMEEQHMFLKHNVGKLWPTIVIQKAKEKLVTEPPEVKYGLFYKDRTGKVLFEEQEPRPPQSTQLNSQIGWCQVRIKEEPIASNHKFAYLGGVDPVDAKIDRFKEMKTKSGYIYSDFSFAIGRRVPIMGQDDPPYVVCEYSGRPEDPEIAYEQMAFAGMYYSDPKYDNYCKFNIERQKAGDLYSFLMAEEEWMNIVGYGTGIAMNLESNRHKFGFHMSDIWWDMMLRQGRKWWRDHWASFWSPQFIEESMVVKEKNTDMVVAYLAMYQYILEINKLIEIGELDDELMRSKVNSQHRSHFVRDNMGRIKSTKTHSPGVVPQQLSNRVMKTVRNSRPWQQQRIQR